MPVIIFTIGFYYFCYGCGELLLDQSDPVILPCVVLGTPDSVMLMEFMERKGDVWGNSLGGGSVAHRIGRVMCEVIFWVEGQLHIE